MNNYKIKCGYYIPNEKEMSRFSKTVKPNHCIIEFDKGFNLFVVTKFLNEEFTNYT